MRGGGGGRVARRAPVLDEAEGAEQAERVEHRVGVRRVRAARHDRQRVRVPQHAQQAALH